MQATELKQSHQFELALLRECAEEKTRRLAISLHSTEAASFGMKSLKEKLVFLEQGIPLHFKEEKTKLRHLVGFLSTSIRLAERLESYGLRKTKLAQVAPHILAEHLKLRSTLERKKFSFSGLRLTRELDGTWLLKESLLGEGRFKKVRRVVDLTNAASFARGTLKKSFRRYQSAYVQRMERLYQEIGPHENLERLHSISYRGGESRAQKVYIYSELYEGGDLAKIDLNRPLVFKLKLLRDAFRGLNYLHKRGYIHGDLKPENVFFRESGEAVLGDLYGAFKQGEGTLAGYTYLFLAPELLAHRSFTCSTDRYAMVLTRALVLCSSKQKPIKKLLYQAVKVKDQVKQRQALEQLLDQVKPQLSDSEGQRQLFSLIEASLLSDCMQGEKRPAIEDFERVFNDLLKA